MLGAKGVAAKMVLAVPAGVCQDELPVRSSGTHSRHPLRLSQGSLPVRFREKLLLADLRNAETVLISLPPSISPRWMHKKAHLG